MRWLYSAVTIIGMNDTECRIEPAGDGGLIDHYCYSHDVWWCSERHDRCPVALALLEARGQRSTVGTYLPGGDPAR